MRPLRLWLWRVYWCSCCSCFWLKSATVPVPSFSSLFVDWSKMDRASSEAVILKRRKHVKHIINEYSMKMRRFRKEIHCQRNAIIKKCQIRDATPRNIFEQRLWQSKYLTPSLIKRELEYDPPSVDAQLFDLEVAESSVSYKVFTSS